MLIKIALDSGAYSAWQQGIELGLDEYISFVAQHSHYLDMVFSLDVIPGRAGGVRTVRHFDEGARQSLENWLYLLDKGVKPSPIPVIHKGESFKAVDNVLAVGAASLIAVSVGGARASPSSARRWLDSFFGHLASTGADVKVHGLGITSLELMMRYPWYSVDSTSWILHASVGKVTLPSNGLDEFDSSPFVINFSPKMKKYKDHWSRVGPEKQRRARLWLDFCGVTLDELAEDYLARARINARYYTEFSKRHTPQFLGVWGYGFLDNLCVDSKLPIPDRTKIYLASTPYQGLEIALFEGGSRHRLLSYDWFHSGRKMSIKTLAESGRFVCKDS